jgi:hypothetical protein
MALVERGRLIVAAASRHPTALPGKRWTQDPMTMTTSRRTPSRAKPANSSKSISGAESHRPAAAAAIAATPVRTVEAPPGTTVAARPGAEATARRFGDVVALNRAGFEAAQRSGGLLLKGMGDINRELASYARSAAEAQFAGAKALLEAGSLVEVVEVQADLIRKSAERFVAQTARIGTLTMAAASSSSAPLAEHWTAAYRAVVRPDSA